MRSSEEEPSSSGMRLHARAGDDGAEDVDGIAGVEDGDGVLVVERGEAEVCDSLFGADGDDGLGFGVERDGVAALVPVADGLAQARQPAGERVAVGGRLLRGLDELVDDVAGGRAVGVAHAEVDDVFAAAARGGLELAGDVEDVLGQTREATEVFGSDCGFGDDGHGTDATL